MTLKVEDPPLVRITLNEEWANKMQNISEMLNSKGRKSRPKNKRLSTRRKTRGSAKVRGE